MDNKQSAASNEGTADDSAAKSLLGDVMASDPLVGTTVVERYKISSVVGFGGWSVVYRAFDSTLNRLVAIKAMHAHLCVDQTKLMRFQREAQASSGLTHQNIAVVYDCGLLWAGRPYISMELVEGESLADYISRGASADIEKTLAIFIQICNGLEAIHNANLIHRDLKPGNIKITDAGAVKILDFGCAKWILQEQNLLTSTDESVGTPAYMSPEQCLGKPVDARSDIYAFGCVMYEVLTGRRPFAADNFLDCMRMHLKAMPPKFRFACPTRKIPEGLEAVVFQALAKDSNDRYASASKLRDALSNSLQDLSFKKRMAEPWQRLGARRRQQVLILITLLALVISSGAVKLWQSTRSRTILFPDSHEVGSVYLIERNEAGQDISRSKIGNAQGAVRVPLNSYVELAEVPKEEAESLTFLQKLAQTDLQRIDLSGTGPEIRAIDNINHLTFLDNLSLNSTAVSDQALEKLKLSALVGLNLAQTSISDNSLYAIAASSPRLRWIQLRGNSHVTNRGIIALAHSPRITALLLQEVSRLDDACLTAVSRANNLGMLVLRGDNITNTGLEYLAPSAKLRSLDLSATHITSDGLNSLLKLKSLKTLCVSDTKIDDAGVAPLSLLKGLSTLNVSSTAMTQQGVKRLRAALPHCKVQADD